MTYDPKTEAHLLKNATQSTCECSHETLADALARAFAEGRLAGLEEAASMVGVWAEEAEQNEQEAAIGDYAYGSSLLTDVASAIVALAGRSDKEGDRG